MSKSSSNCSIEQESLLEIRVMADNNVFMAENNDLQWQQQETEAEGRKVRINNVLLYGLLYRVCEVTISADL
jgi:hypothetical protein